MNKKFKKHKKQFSTSDFLKLAYNRSSEFVIDLLQGPEGVAKFVKDSFEHTFDYLDHPMPWTNGTWDLPFGQKPTSGSGGGIQLDTSGSRYNPYLDLDFDNTGSLSYDAGTVIPSGPVLETFSKPTGTVAGTKGLPKANPQDSGMIATVAAMGSGEVMLPSSTASYAPSQRESSNNYYYGPVHPFDASGWEVGVNMTKDKSKKKNKQKKQKSAQAKEAKKLFKKLNANSTYNKNEFGPVTTLTSAPVAIGNSIRGAPHQVTAMKNGVCVIGRDYMFPLKDCATAVAGGGVNWLLVGGTALTPTAFGSTCLANYSRMYAKYRIKKFVVHYITSSATSATGDVLFYHAKNRDSPFVQVSSSNLIPVVLSDPSTVMGPLWVNHSAKMWVTGDWKSLEYGMHAGVNDYSDGEVFVLRKSANPCYNSGYVIFDYKIEFAELQLSPRNLSFPIPRIQYHNLCLNSNAAVTANNPVSGNTGGVPLLLEGNDLANTAATLPAGIAYGDIFKCILDITNSTKGGFTGFNTIFQTYTNASSASGFSLSLIDGSTIYLSYLSLNKFAAYATVEEAYTQQSCLVWAETKDTDFALQAWISYVGTAQSPCINPNMS